MSNNIIVHDVTKITEVKFEQIKYDNYFIKKYIPINKYSDIPLHKFWLLAEKCKVIDVGSSYVNFVFSSKSKYLLDKLEIENKIRLHFKKKLHTENDLLTHQKINYDKSTVLFNSNDIEDKYEILSGNEFDIIAELDYIELCANHINFIWRMVQMKKISIINLKMSLFAKQSNNVVQRPIFQNTEDFGVPKYDQSRSLPPPQHTSQMQSQRNIPVAPPTIQNQPKSFAFTPDLLQNALLKLKKPKLEEDEVKMPPPIKGEHIVETIKNLKHVETQEVSIIEIYREEYKEQRKNEYKKIVKLNEQMNKILEIANNNILTGLQLLKKIDRLNQHGRISDDSKRSKKACL